MTPLRRRFVIRRLLPALAGGVMVAIGVVLLTDERGSATADRRPLCLERPAPNFDPTWPQSTLTDWVSYSDQLSIVTVVGEKALSPLEETDENGGMVGRSVTLAIERTLWRRDGAPSVKGDVSVVTWGWMVDGDDPHRLRVGGGPWLEVGGRYIVPLTRSKSDDGFEWGSGPDMAIFPLDGTTIVCGSVRETEFAGEDISGTSVEEFAARFAATKPDPLAVKFGRLDPNARWQAVARGQ
jgi:hypothetical protein